MTNWQSTTLGDIAEIVGGGTPSTSDASNFAEGGIPWITPADLSGFEDAYVRRGARNLSQKGYAACGARLLPSGTVLFSSRAPIGYCVIAAEPVSTNQGFRSLILREGILPEYVRYFLLYSKKRIEDRASGTTFKEISGRALAEVPIAVPEQGMQSRVVAALDLQLSRLKAVERGLAHARTRLAQARSATLKAAVEGRLVPTEADLARAEGRDYEHASVLLARILEERRARHETEQTGAKRKKKYQEPVAPEVEGLPELQEGWVWATVDQLGRVQTGSTPPTGHAGHYAGPEGLPFIKPSELDFPDPVGAARSFLSEEGTRLARPLPPLSVLVTCIGATIGKTGIVRSACATNQQINAVVPERSIRETRFLHLAFISPLLQESILANASATTLPILNKSRFSALPVPLPPLAEQHRRVKFQNQ